MSDERAKVRELAPRCFAVVCSGDDSVYGGFGANQGFILLEESVLVFDSGFSLIQARNLHRAIRNVTDKKVKYVVNSHDHSDHVFGNSFFQSKYGRSGLSIISHEVCRNKLLAMGPKRLKNYRKIPDLENKLKSIEIQEPDFTYSDIGIRISLEGTELVFSHPSTGAHTLGDTALYLPKERTAFMGDIVWNRFFPNLEDADLEGWISYLDEIDFGIYRRILPGHGEICDSNRVSEFTDYLRTVRSNLLEVDPKKSDHDSLRACFVVPGTEKWKLEPIIDYNVDSIFLKRSGS